MTGPDFLRAIIDSGISEERDRRHSAVRAFLAHQYKNDEEVRFKAVELQNKLLDLFIDVPVGVREDGSNPRQAKAFISILRLLGSEGESQDFNVVSDSMPIEVWRHHRAQDTSIGAATLVLSGLAQKKLPQIVLEGAPGQGKSTIAQYICQVHRMKLLGESDGLQAIAPQHRDSPTRLPIKVDLRDFATWLRKEDPFTPGGESLTPPRWKKSLEAFLAALISTYSGGTIFGSDDFIALVRINAVLLVLDGLDEVADIPRRREVVDEIVSGIQRLKANAASLQTIVTSRPAAFANSPGIPALTFPCLQLLSLSRSSIDQYAERWMRARRLDSKEASDFKKVLKAKLDQPHLRDLARNPMQLAILLSLVLRRGDLST